MTPEDRAIVRGLIDAARRRRVLVELAIDRERPRSRFCSECGAELDNQTAGCRACTERHRRRWLRANDPAFNERARLEVKRYRRQRAERGRAAA